MMRRVMLAAAFALIAGAAQAQSLFDTPVLRGSIAPTVPRFGPNWQGFYVGGQFGAGFANMNFSNSTRSMAHQLLIYTTIENEYTVSEWPIMGETGRFGAGVGGFFGYNSQWDKVVLSLEGSYLHAKFDGMSTGSLARMFTTSDQYSNNVTHTGSASVVIHDMMSVRGRAGYAWGNFLPYMFGGISLGYADIFRSVTIDASGTYVGTDLPGPPPYGPVTLSAVDSNKRQFITGYSVGLGADIMLAGGLFLRGEYDYTRFTPSATISINTIRGGVGYKF
jgi:outer membrane immunogenic protein